MYEDHEQHDPMTQLLVSNARILEKIEALSESRRVGDDRLSRDIADVKAEHGLRITNLEVLTAGMRLSMARAVGVASVVAVVLSALISVGMSKLFDMWGG